MRTRSILACATVAAVATATGASPALAGHKSHGHKSHGFRTSQPSMLTPVMPGASVTPLLTVGDTLRSGYRFESIPDGISVRTKRGHKTA